ncbi:MAG: PPC domain-containing protein, partial [Actinomycetota bacterium]
MRKPSCGWRPPYRRDRPERPAVRATPGLGDWVGSTDTNDFYRFDLGTQSNFSLLLNGLSADADVQLLNSSGGVISGSYNWNNSSESITNELSAGTY